MLMKKNSMKSYNANLRIIHDTFFRIGAQILFLLVAICSNAHDFPVKLDSIDNIYYCDIDTTKLFDINSIVIKLKKNHIVDTALLACVYHQLGFEYLFKADYQNTIKYNKEAIKLCEKFNCGWKWKSQFNLALSYYYTDNYNDQINYSEQALLQVGNPIDSLLIYRLLAEGYLSIGEIEQAAQYAGKAIKIKGEIDGVRSALITYSQILTESKDIDKIENGINRLDSLDNIFVRYRDSIKIIKVKNILGNAYNHLNNFDKSIQYYKEALKYEDFIPSKSELINNIATVYTDQGNFSKALHSLNRAYELNKNYFKNDFHYSYAANFENFGDYYVKSDTLDSALLNYQKALINLTDNFRNEDIFQNPNPKDTSLFIYSNPVMIEVLHLKATATYQYYQQSDSIKFLNLAHQTYQTLIDFHNKLQKEISTENSRLFQATNILTYLEQALEVAYKLQEKGGNVAEATFRLIEKNKATVLLQSMNEADALQFANLPDSLLEEEKDLKIAIAINEQRLNEAQQEKETLTLINELENTLFENKEKYRRLIKNLEENYTDYYQLKYQQNLTSLNEIQNRLDENLALLEYFVGDSNIYVLSIQKDKAKLYKKQKPTDWQNNISIFLEALKDEYSDKNEQFVSISYNLYQTLLKEPLEDLGDNITRLQIIPDGELNQIPFEVLLTPSEENTDSPNYGNLPYLIQKYSISYVYSANLLMDNLGKPKLLDAISYGAYASKHEIDEEEEDLYNVREQIKEFRDYFKGVAFLSEEATKARFIKDTNAYKILHFGMHGYVNDTLPLNSNLVFTKTDSLNKLYASDLYNIKLNTELAVLNACKTGTGQLQKGEGVMSLSRAFTYAGCPSLIMSLSNIFDISSGKVLKGFFKNLEKGNSKDLALQQAKLNFLENNQHPSHWAGLVVVGNLGSLDLKSEQPISLYKMSILIICLILLFLILYHFKTKTYNYCRFNTLH